VDASPRPALGIGGSGWQRQRGLLTPPELGLGILSTIGSKPKRSLRISLTGKRFGPVCAGTHTYPSMVTGNTHMAERWHRTKESGEQPRQDQISRVSCARRYADRLWRSGGTGSNDWLNERPGMAVMREQGIVAGELNEVNEQVAARCGCSPHPTSRSSPCCREASCSTASSTTRTSGANRPTSQMCAPIVRCAPLPDEAPDFHQRCQGAARMGRTRRQQMDLEVPHGVVVSPMTSIRVLDRRARPPWGVIRIQRCSLAAPVTEDCFAEHPLVITHFHPT
jgi:hypothetical protein